MAPKDNVVCAFIIFFLVNCNQSNSDSLAPKHLDFLQGLPLRYLDPPSGEASNETTSQPSEGTLRLNRLNNVLQKFGLQIKIFHAPVQKHRLDSRGKRLKEYDFSQFCCIGDALCFIGNCADYMNLEIF